MRCSSRRRGAGKTLAGFLPTLADLIENPADGLHTLYISPLKALAVDVQRNLLTPVEEMGAPIRIETRTGDTPWDRKVRQRARPPQILLTTPESLSLLLSYEDSLTMFAGLKTVVIDEVHAFATGKRGDLLALAMARLQRLAPGLRRVALSATVADPDGYRAWLAPHGDIDSVTLVQGEKGAEPNIAILLPEDKVPWAGHSGVYAIPQVMAEIETHGTTIVFCNTRGLAELVFQQLWKVNELKLPIGVHHGSLSLEARRRAEQAMADGRLRALVATASLDLGVDWGDVDCVIQMGAPKGSSRLLQRIGRANHRLDEPSEAVLVPGNRFEYLEARAAPRRAVEQGDARSRHLPSRCARRAGAARDGAAPAPRRSLASELLHEIRAALPYSALADETFDRVLSFIADGGYALRAYDKFKRLTLGERTASGASRRPPLLRSIGSTPASSSNRLMLEVRFRNGRRLGTVEEDSPRRSRRAIPSSSPGWRSRWSASRSPT